MGKFFMIKFFKKILRSLVFNDPVPMNFYIGNIEGESLKDVKSRFNEVNFSFVSIVNLPEKFHEKCIWHSFNSTYWVVEFFSKKE